MIEVLDAVVEFKRKNLHASFEIHRKIFLKLDEFRLAFFVDGAVEAVVEPLEINANAYTEPILDKTVLPMDTSFIIKRWCVDKLCACNLLTSFQIEFPVPEAEPHLHKPIERVGMIQVLVAERRLDRISNICVSRIE